MKVQGREYVDYSFKKISDGWHTFEILEGIVVFTNEKSGKKSLMVPF